MTVMQDGVEVYALSDGACCGADDEKRNPLDIDVCPLLHNVCDGDCYYYRKDS